jgi:HK97 family phage major capsid protein
MPGTWRAIFRHACAIFSPKRRPDRFGGTSPGWGDELADFSQVAAGFIASLAHVGVFDTIAAAAPRVPMGTIASIVTATASGGAVAEGALKPASELVLANEQLEIQKAVAFVVVSSELLKLSPAGQNLILSELRNAAARATDEAFVDALVAASTPIASGGDVLEDIGALLAELNTGAASVVFLILPAVTAKRIITIPANTTPPSTGVVAFPNMTLTGGTIAGVQVLVSDAITDQVIAVDAAQLAVDPGTVMLSTADAANIDLGAGGSHSLWQRNEQGLRAERFFGFQLLRAGASASLSGVSWGATSP